MVSTALLLDNMLFMVIVPIITQILALDEPQQPGSSIINRPSLANLLTRLDLGEAGPFLNETSMPSGESEDISIGILFASKAIVQLLGNALFKFTLTKKQSLKVYIAHKKQTP